MARISQDPYTFHQATFNPDCPRLGSLLDGVDNVLGLPARFRFVKHVNAVTVVSGHCAGWVAVPTATGASTVTNDITGGADGNSLLIAAGAYCCVPAQGEYCYIQTWGYHPTLLGDGSVAITEAIMMKAGTDGTWDSFTGVVPQCGECWLDDTGSPAVFPGFLRIA